MPQNQEVSQPEKVLIRLAITGVIARTRKLNSLLVTGAVSVRDSFCGLCNRVLIVLSAAGGKKKNLV